MIDETALALEARQLGMHYAVVAGKIKLTYFGGEQKFKTTYEAFFRTRGEADTALAAFHGGSRAAYLFDFGTDPTALAAQQARSKLTGDRPKPRLLRDPHDAEQVAAEWMRYWGWTDAAALPVGPDGGIDVQSSEAVAQVKAHMRPIGRPDIQNLYGVAAHMRREALFFSLMSYTPAAIQWANEAGVALFRFDHQGQPEEVNAVAAKLLARQTGRID